MGRKFIAVVPAGLSENVDLRQLLRKLKRTISDRGQTVRWVHPDLWHVTLAFMGELGEGDGLRKFLEKWEPKIKAVNLRLHGVGAFPSTDEARVLWIGVQENQEFLDLQSELQNGLSKAGFAMSDKDFNPHLTLARFRNISNVDDLVKLGGRKHFGDYQIGELILFDSVLQGNILKYSPVFRKKL